MENYKIVDPIFLDLEKTIVRFTLVDELGNSKIAEFKVPANREKGVNEYWDKIVEEFDIEQMRKRRNDLEIRRRQTQQFDHKKSKASLENRKLVDLFEHKAKAFEYFFIKEASSEVKSCVRKAQDKTILQGIISHQISKYMEENNISLSEFIDKLDE